VRTISESFLYVDQQNDNTLFDTLIEQTLNKSKDLVPGLLDAVKSHPCVNISELIGKIPHDLKINNLKSRIIGVFEEMTNELSLSTGTVKILQSDCLILGNSHK